MSIQSGWNSALATLGRIAGAKKLTTKINRTISNIGDEAAIQRAQVETHNRQAEDPNFVGPLTLDQEARRSYARGVSEGVDNAFQDAAPGLGTPAYEEQMSEIFNAPTGQAMMEQQIAEQQAAEAAAIADMAPQNHGYMESLEQQVESTTAANADPMAELNRMTNEAMDEMYRRANMGGNN